MPLKTENNNRMYVQPNRYYAFDYLKTIMMFSVVVAHAASTYMVINVGSLWPAKDPKTTNVFFDVVLAFMSCNTMPVFFAISGFLAAMLVQKGGEKKMFNNRLKRIFYPFLASIITLAPLSSLAFYYFDYTLTGMINPLQLAFKRIAEEGFGLFNFNFRHLWFLYCLVLFCLTGGFISYFFRRISTTIPNKLIELFSFFFQKKSAPLLFALPTFILLYIRHRNFIETPINFNTNIVVLFTYAVFFFFGWLLYYQNDITRFKKWDIPYAILGTVFFVAKLTIYAVLGDDKTTEVWLAAVTAIFIWFYLFAFLGLSLRFFNKYSRIASYLSDASYWIYLVHIPVVLIIQTLLINFNVNALVKFSIVTFTTFIITLISYNYLVRNTFIGTFLSGKRYSRGLPSKE